MAVKKVVVRFGQSNQEGRGLYSELPAALDGPQANTYIWNRVAGAVQTLDASTGNHRSFAAGPHIWHGPEMSAAAAAVADLGEIYIFKYSIDGTSLGPNTTTYWWHPNDPSVGNMVTYFQTDWAAFVAAMGVLGHTVEVLYISWFQGESDAIFDGLDEAYYGSFKYLMTTVREFFADYYTAGAEIPWVTHLIHKGIIPNGFGYLRPRVNNVRAAQIKAGRSYRKYRVVETSDYPHSDDLHLDSAGCVQAGTDEYAAYQLGTSNY